MISSSLHKFHVFRLTQQRVAFVSTDTCMITDAIKTIVIEKLKQLYGNLYVTENVMLSGTHTHAGPGGYSWSLHSPFLSFFHSF